MAKQGASVVFAVGAVGTPLPLSYQWQFNGANIYSATSNLLSLTNVQPANAGNYTVVVGNAGAAWTNASAGLRVLPALSYTSESNKMILTWSGPYTLQSATNVTGPYFDLSVAASPYTNLIGSEPRRYFRLRATLRGIVSPAVTTNGSFVINASGLAGYTYAVQASTNLVDWVTIQTNPVPFRFADPDAQLFRTRFYRTLLVP